MTPNQLHMISIKSMIEQIVESYLSTQTEEATRDFVSQLLNSFKVSGKITSYSVALTYKKDKLSVMFVTNTGDGCETTFLVAKYKVNVYRNLKELLTKPVNKHVVGEVLQKITQQSIYPSSEVIVHSNSLVTESLCALAVWQAAFTEKQNIVYVVPMSLNKDAALQNLHAAAVQNSLYVTSVSDYTVSFNNNSNIRVISLAELYSNNSRFQAQSTHLTICDIQLKELVTSTDLFNQVYLSFCYIVESINYNNRKYNNSLVVVCDNWAIHNFAIANSVVKDTYQVGMSVTGAVLHNLGAPQ